MTVFHVETTVECIEVSLSLGCEVVANHCDEFDVCTGALKCLGALSTDWAPVMDATIQPLELLSKAHRLVR